MFLAAYPQHFSSSLDIPRVGLRNSYFKHNIGPIQLITLDSGAFTHSNSKKQIEFLIKCLDSNQNFIPIIIYSESLFPSCIQEYSDFDFKSAQKELLPIIDNYKIPLVFENGSNYFKRTKPIYRGKPFIRSPNSKDDTQKGTIYLGDGNFGSDFNECPKDYQISDDYFEKRDKYNNFWWITTSNSKRRMRLRAYNLEGQIIDSFEMGIQNFKVKKSPNNFLYYALLQLVEF